MYIILYMSWCVCVCTHFNFHFHCGCGSLFLPRQPTIDSSTTKSKYHHYHHQHYNNNNNKYYETTAMSLMQIFAYSKSNRNRIKTAKKKRPTKKPTTKLKRGKLQLAILALYSARSMERTNVLKGIYYIWYIYISLSIVQTFERALYMNI